MTELKKATEGSIFSLLEPRRDDIIRFIGEDRFKKEVAFAIQAVQSNRLLMSATQNSIAKAIYNLAITGLSLNPILKLAYLTPRMICNEQQAILMPSYQGLVKLIADTGSVLSIYAHVVYEGDEFVEELGTEPVIIHRPKHISKDIVMVYAVAKLPDGTKLSEVMDVEDVHKIRAKSDAYRAYNSGKTSTCIWITDEGEMFRKTVIKRISKYVPKTDRWLQVQEAINLDDQEFPATDQQKDFIETLLKYSTYDEDTRDIIRDKCAEDISSEEANNIIEDLKRNQVDRINAGHNYNQTDIKEKLTREI